MSKEKLILPENKFYHSGKPNTTVVNKDSIEAMTPEMDKSVIGEFVNIECPGQPAKICGKYYKGMQYFSKTFQDGEKAKIPLSVARWINERVKNQKHSFILDKDGNQIKGDLFHARYKFVIEQYAA